MRTIVQEYGPIYGEPVNGTVMGRPNGSVYVPLSNTIDLNMIIIANDHVKYRQYNSKWYLNLCKSDGTLVYSANQGFKVNADAQDLGSYIQMQMYSDSGLTDLVASQDAPAALFNFTDCAVYAGSVDTDLTDGQSIYLRAQLLNNGTAIATSPVIELTMVVPS